MEFWTFLDYITEDRKWPINDWWKAQDETVQAAFELLVKTLSQTEDWEDVDESRRKHRVLKKEHAGMCELAFEVKPFGKYRGLGLWRPLEREFIFFGACLKKMKPFRTIPPNAFDTAYKLILEFNLGKGVTREHY